MHLTAGQLDEWPWRVELEVFAAFGESEQGRYEHPRLIVLAGLCVRIEGKQYESFALPAIGDVVTLEGPN